MSGSARINPFLLALLGCLLVGLAGCGRTLEVGALGGACTGRQFQSCAVDGKQTVRLFCDASTHTWALLETCTDRCHVDWTGDDVITTCFNDFFTNGSPGFAQDTVSSRSPDGCDDGCGDTCGDNECSPGEICAADCNVEPKPPCGGPCPAGFVCREDANACLVQTCATPAVWANVQKVTAWAYSAKTEGCDLDGDGKPDNAVGRMLDVIPDANAGLAGDIAEGKLVMLFQAPVWSPDGKPFKLRVVEGALADTEPACEPTGAGCACLAQPASYDLASPATGTCPPRWELQAAVVGGTLTAIAAKPVAVKAWLFTGILIDIHLQGVQIAAQVTGTEGWDATASGRLCGYFTKAEMSAALDRVPAAAMAQLGDISAVKGLVGSILKADLDLDGDGTKDAYSASFDFKTAAATITGVVAP